MEQKDKELLLIDLCARLPYGVIVQDRNGTHVLTPGNTELGTEYIKPYLRPMSSMTEAEDKEFAYKILQQPDLSAVRNYKILDIGFTDLDKVVDWLNKHHFDYRGLIEKGLAIEAPVGMYKTE